MTLEVSWRLVLCGLMSKPGPCSLPPSKPPAGVNIINGVPWQGGGCSWWAWVAALHGCAPVAGVNLRLWWDQAGQGVCFPLAALLDGFILVWFIHLWSVAGS